MQSLQKNLFSIIAIDGEAASGKGSISRFLCHSFSLSYMDTGQLYRLAGLLLKNLSHSIWIKTLTNYDLIGIIQDPNNNYDLKSEEAAILASKIAVHPEIRHLITTNIRSFIQKATQNKKGVVLDGRDVGTAIVPNAPIKFYITASQDVRAQRRLLELQSNHPHLTYEEISHQLKQRDTQDKTRTYDPLVIAPYAHIIDTTNLSLDDACKVAYDIVLNNAGKNIQT